MLDDKHSGIGSAHAPRLVIMAKMPVMGRVKTRLAAQIGAVAATYFYRHAARAVLMRLASDPRWRTILALSPDTNLETGAWPPQIARIGQGRGGLGTRMQAIFDRLPPGPVVLIGTDIPAVSRTHIAQAFTALKGRDAVLGAADDGGYWLVGQRRLPRSLPIFADVRWSSPTTLADTMANLKRHQVGFAPVLSDVDDAAAFINVRGWSGRVILPSEASRRDAAR